MNLIPYALQGQDEIQGSTTFRKLTALHVKLPGNSELRKECWIRQSVMGTSSRLWH